MSRKSDDQEAVHQASKQFAEQLMEAIKSKGDQPAFVSVAGIQEAAKGAGITTVQGRSIVQSTLGSQIVSLGAKPELDEDLLDKIFDTISVVKDADEIFATPVKCYENKEQVDLSLLTGLVILLMRQKDHQKLRDIVRLSIEKASHAALVCLGGKAKVRGNIAFRELIALMGKFPEDALFCELVGIAINKVEQSAWSMQLHSRIKALGSGDCALRQIVISANIMPDNAAVLQYVMRAIEATTAQDWKLEFVESDGFVVPIFVEFLGAFLKNANKPAWQQIASLLIDKLPLDMWVEIAFIERDKKILPITLFMEGLIKHQNNEGCEALTMQLLKKLSPNDWVTPVDRLKKPIPVMSLFIEHLCSILRFQIQYQDGNRKVPRITPETLFYLSLYAVRRDINNPFFIKFFSMSIVHSGVEWLMKPITMSKSGKVGLEYVVDLIEPVFSSNSESVRPISVALLVMLMRYFKSQEDGGWMVFDSTLPVRLFEKLSLYSQRSEVFNLLKLVVKKASDEYLKGMRDALSKEGESEQLKALLAGIDARMPRVKEAPKQKQKPKPKKVSVPKLQPKRTKQTEKPKLTEKPAEKQAAILPETPTIASISESSFSSGGERQQPLGAEDDALRSNASSEEMFAAEHADDIPETENESDSEASFTGPSDGIRPPSPLVDKEGNPIRWCDVESDDEILPAARSGLFAQRPVDSDDCTPDNSITYSA